MSPDPGRIVQAVHGLRHVADDPPFFEDMAGWLRAAYSRDALSDVYSRYMHGDDPLNAAMRAVVWRAMARRVGRRLQIGSGVSGQHLETVEIGEGVFIGAQTYVQGRYDGSCVIGDHVWI